MSFEGAGENVGEERPRLYSCKYCDRFFTSSQALGGHQNGHKSEREAIKRTHDPEFLAYQNSPPVPLPAIPSLPLPTLNPSQLTYSRQPNNLLYHSSSLIRNPTHYQTYPQPYYLFNNTNRDAHAPRLDLGSSSSKTSLYGSTSTYGGGPRNVSYGRLPNWMGTGVETVVEAAAAAAAGPSSSINMSQGIWRDGGGNNNCADDKEDEIDLTLHL